jgi:hypothetical protein
MSNPSLRKCATCARALAYNQGEGPLDGARSGPSFWLCPNEDEGNYPAEALVPSMEASRTLADRIDIFSVAHPSVKDPSGRYVVLEDLLFYDELLTLSETRPRDRRSRWRIPSNNAH